jgi:hypothetical protein
LSIRDRRSPVNRPKQRQYRSLQHSSVQPFAARLIFLTLRAFATTDSDPHTITLPDALGALSRLCLLHYPIDADTTVTRLPKPDVRQKQILTALGVALPDK